ncbi:MAG TPA: di-trans,poly-cis-decaprenylcistransferase, partial [Candidatus Coprenecus stercoripullorum]|nr:di-trans,poly-cis-decaprenylcistransferase [Candidatus Coprenecus stercoripullorum]
MSGHANAVPAHVAIIMDGNGRWAAKRGKDRIFGHYEGAESVRACCEYAVEAGVKYLSLFAFSEENWNRPEAEVSELMALMARSVLNERSTFARNNIRFTVIGDMSRIPRTLADDISAAME